jgi:hypothetical protein
MAHQYSVAVNNARLDVTETTIGATAHFKIYSGAIPANCAAAATGTLLADLTLPSDWMAAASAGSKVKAGVWSGVGAAAGVSGYFRITDTAGTTAHIQGTCGMSGTDAIIDNSNIAVAQNITVNSFQLTAANT